MPAGHEDNDLDCTDDWSNVSVFGVRPAVGASVIRPSTYGLIADDHGRLAVVRTDQGVFLPGGGIVRVEAPAGAMMREALEECGLVVRVGSQRVAGDAARFSRRHSPGATAWGSDQKPRR
jgi:8-oxo-dGTP pyrophosphatase MutT (NUDIX family)